MHCEDSFFPLTALAAKEHPATRQIKMSAVCSDAQLGPICCNPWTVDHSDSRPWILHAYFLKENPTQEMKNIISLECYYYKIVDILHSFFPN